MMESPSRIAFGSCNHQDHQNNFWPIIQARSPAAFIWGGDAIYADYEPPMDWSQIPPRRQELQCATPTRLRQLYKEQKRVPGYRRLLKSNMTVFGTFDDHDYGCNNADQTYEFRYKSGLEYANFLSLPQDSPMRRRVQAGLGVYGVKLFDFDRLPGNQEVPDEVAMIDPDAIDETLEMVDILPPTYSNRSVAVFVLDIRSNKSPWKQGSEAYSMDYEGDFLGEAQWQWLEVALRRSRAAVNVVVSGIQFHSNSLPNPNIAESWGKFPRAQQRLFDAVLQDGVQAPILVSGDVHMTQFMRKDCQRRDGRRTTTRPLIEMTTSGMTHSWGTSDSPPLSNPNQRPSLYERYETLFSRTLLTLMHKMSPWTDLMISQPESESGLYDNSAGEGATQGLQYSLEKNFGEIEFDWETGTVSLRTVGEDPMAPPLLMGNWTLDQLNGRDNIPGSILTDQDFVQEAISQHPRQQGDWICINHRGSENVVWQAIGHLTTIGLMAMLFPFPFFLPFCVALLMFRRKRRGNKSSSIRSL